EGTTASALPGDCGPHPLTPAPCGRGGTVLGSAAELGVPETGHEVVVHHPDRLHERVTDGRPDEPEAPLRESGAHRVRFPAPGGGNRCGPPRSGTPHSSSC